MHEATRTSVIHRTQCVSEGLGASAECTEGADFCWRELVSGLAVFFLWLAFSAANQVTGIEVLSLTCSSAFIYLFLNYDFVHLLSSTFLFLHF